MLIRVSLARGRVCDSERGDHRTARRGARLAQRRLAQSQARRRLRERHSRRLPARQSRGTLALRDALGGGAVRRVAGRLWPSGSGGREAVAEGPAELTTPRLGAQSESAEDQGREQDRQVLARHLSRLLPRLQRLLLELLHPLGHPPHPVRLNPVRRRGPGGHCSRTPSDAV